ncbi:MAG: glycosyltransferase family 4 protein [Candidatus Omnitrophica bacterium]|nr:glycosyltransferase family 4 protein [Candidatus Omnitrophota bacterium]MBU1047363.1 glycosyltransferase family 4 protein [Candidatus Omnitrophota bacterium]MBU1630865.1 glycosyltransferase family 4 protein [Candidatus Omnitrophota bacterium]MBU1767477.1 glycosyltransferase family 4 protein [Candidatus Omnitrophota bacterium]MBU1889052.1 glycosyltransferase family 4 protein [Candidatus Omnitrophota bacterium]
MKIAIINMTNGGISGGYKKYLLNILPRLASNDNIDSLLCISPSSLQVDTWFSLMQNVEFVNCSPFGFLKFRFDRSLKQKLIKFSPDLIFVPVARHFEFSGVPVLNMVQNILPFLRKEVDELSFSEKLRLYIQHIESVKALKLAKRTIVTSNFVKDFLIEKAGISKEKISLVYFGKDSPAEDISKPPGIPNGLEKKFLFTAGSLEPYRGTEDIIKAARYLKKDFPDLRILIAGQSRTATLSYHRKLLALSKSYGLSSNIIWTGQLNQSELAWCYQNCAMFIITSRMETFGMIALEAMANGCLCIAADNPPFPEILSDCAYYYSPKDSHSLVDAIKNVASWNDEKKLEITDKAKKRAESFSWDNTLEGLIREFELTII